MADDDHVALKVSRDSDPLLLAWLMARATTASATPCLKTFSVRSYHEA